MENVKKKLHLISLGCTKNLIDSEVMLGRLSSYNLTDRPDDADVIIINSCGFIEAAKKESIAAVLEVHERRKAGSVLVMSGCLSERYKKEIREQMPEIDILTGVGDYDRIDELLRVKKDAFSDRVYLADENSPRLITGSSCHAYIKIAEGCNQHCSFCAIPSFKGRLKSRTLESIAAEVSALVQKGFFDFTFISQDSSSYGRDIGMVNGLSELIRHIEMIGDVKSARILYLYPSTTTFETIDAIADSPIFQNYYDIPIQHIDDTMLKKMKRGLGETKTIRLLERMHSKPEAFVRTSVIAGHPEESENSFDRLCSFLKEFAFDRVNIFAYSNEENTGAYLMEQLSSETIAFRTEILGEIARDSMISSLEKEVGKRTDLIINGYSDEHEYLLSARPIKWAPEIDGEILINDVGCVKPEVCNLYRAYVTERAGDKLLSTLLEKA